MCTHSHLRHWFHEKLLLFVIFHVQLERVGLTIRELCAVLHKRYMSVNLRSALVVRFYILLSLVVLPMVATESCWKVVRPQLNLQELPWVKKLFDVANIICCLLAALPNI